jgi:Patatin-like phospholipase
MSSGQVFGFNDVFREEIAVINARRERQRGTIVLRQEVDASTGGPVIDASGAAVIGPNEDANVVGLALSGGGVRSAAFCLGALQGLNETGVLERVDYLSTVSGGGYIGCSLSAGLETTGGEFPFERLALEDETPAVQHLRDYSNYLFPRGAIDVLHNASIYMRGLVANFVLIMPFLLVAAALTIVLHPTVGDPQHANVLAQEGPFNFRFFVVTAYLILMLLVLGMAWGLIRSRAAVQNTAEVPSRLTHFVGWAVLLVIFSAFCELQPFVLAAMFDAKAPGFFAAGFRVLNEISLALAPIAAAIGFLGSKLGEFVKSAKESSRIRAQIAGYAAKAAIYFAAIVVPFLLWVVYLNLSYWGICISSPAAGCAAPGWLSALADHWFAEPKGKLYWLVSAGYVLLATFLFLLSLLLRANANSLHPLYRDRLGKAFLFEPQPTLQKSEELEPARLHLSQLSGRHGPYHLINTALNIQKSKTANKRGRNADFFLLSQNFVGSESTGYVATKDMEKVATGLDLATAMAVSGAAASSSMGAQSIKALTPTLAILNIRLGYWLRNPSWVAKGGPRNIWTNFYFLLELFGRLNECRKSVYLTDGGHIENLGIYELLKRRCRVIIAVDAEADPEMAFGSFNTLVRYARIDLGLEIDLPWQQITNATRRTSHEIDTTGDCRKLKGPHCAIGQINYPCGRKGILVYIKSSLTGDENDYVFHYRKRYAQFPHETTLDQMFSEEQFEAYRALGYHAAYGLFDRRDDFAKLDPAEFPQASAHAQLLDRLFPRVTKSTPGPHQRFFDWPYVPSVADPVEAA